MNLPQFASLLLASALQVLPLMRASQAVIPAAAPIMAIVFRLAALSAAVLGAVDAVSGATVLPPEVTTSLNETVFAGDDFEVPLTTAPYLSPYWTAEGLPEGLVLEGAAGDEFWSIRGRPKTPGVYLVSLTAYSPRFNGPVNATLVLSVMAPNGPPDVLIQSIERTKDQVVLRWTSPVGARYEVLAADTPVGPWSKVITADMPAEQSGLTTAVVPTDPAKPLQFYRVQLLTNR